MSEEIKRKKGETFEAMLRRFNKRIQQSGKILTAKKMQHREKDTSRNLKRSATLHRLKVRSQKDYLRKTGQLKEDEFKTKYFRR